MNVDQVVEKDAIPSVDDPVFGERYDGNPEDSVVVVDADPPRAYPIRYLDFHEIVNDVEGRPIAVTWCPICGSAAVYDRRVAGRTLEFGVSGKLADDALVMYDRQTNSEWKQSSGVCIAGDLEGKKLEVLPAAITAWAFFRAETPHGVVLQPPGGASEAASDGADPAPIDYDERPYREYVKSEGFGLAERRGETPRSWDRDDIDPKEVVVGVEHGGEAVGYLHSHLETAGGVVTDAVGGQEIVVFAAGGGVHAFENPGFAFEPTGDGRRFRADRTRWDGTTGRSDDGRRLTRIPARRLFAFAWQDDHGRDAFYR